MRVFAIVPAAVSFNSEGTLFALSTQCRQVAESVACGARMQQSLQFATAHPGLVIGTFIVCVVCAVTMSLRS